MISNSFNLPVLQASMDRFCKGKCPGNAIRKTEGREEDMKLVRRGARSNVSKCYGNMKRILGFLSQVKQFREKRDVHSRAIQSLIVNKTWRTVN